MEHSFACVDMLLTNHSLISISGIIAWYVKHDGSYFCKQLRCCVKTVCATPEALQAQAAADPATEPVVQLECWVTACRCWSPWLLHEEAWLWPELDTQARHQCKHVFVCRVRTDPGKVWKVLEFNVEIFKALKSLENDHRYGKVWKNLWKL